MRKLKKSNKKSSLKLEDKINLITAIIGLITSIISLIIALKGMGLL